MKLEIKEATDLDTKLHPKVNDHFEHIKPIIFHGKIWRVIELNGGLRLVSVKSGHVWNEPSLWGAREGEFIPWKGEYTITVD